MRNLLQVYFVLSHLAIIFSMSTEMTEITQNQNAPSTLARIIYTDLYIVIPIFIEKFY